jgi:hypothetical protein
MRWADGLDVAAAVFALLGLFGAAAAFLASLEIGAVTEVFAMAFWGAAGSLVLAVVLWLVSTVLGRQAGKRARQ